MTSDEPTNGADQAAGPAGDHRAGFSLGQRVALQRMAEAFPQGFLLALPEGALHAEGLRQVSFELCLATVQGFVLDRTRAQIAALARVERADIEGRGPRRFPSGSAPGAAG
uniref:Uncharacterized protein n=1 Tax=viral metagenome TaxID=1070528 RepID=A0A6M3J8X3_9ZZZZ